MSTAKSTSGIPQNTQKRMNAATPTTKVTGAAVAAAIVQVLTWMYESAQGTPLPIGVTGSLTVIATFAAGYLVPPSSQEQVVDAVRRPTAQQA